MFPMVDFLNETSLSFPVAAESLAGAVQREAKQRQYRVMAGQVAGCRTAAWCCPYCAPFLSHPDGETLMYTTYVLV